MPVHVTHQFNPATVRALLASPQGGVARDMFKRGLRVQAAARRFVSGAGPGHPKRVDTGRLRNDIAVTLVNIGGFPGVRVGTHLKYAIWVHDGTGLYGPRHAWIKPRQAKFLVFKSAKYGAKKGKGKGKVFVKRVRGIQPNPFLKAALPYAKTGA